VGFYNIYNRICKIASKFEKEILKLGRRSSLKYAECAYAERRRGKRRLKMNLY